ncbi:hypothetical protein ABK040_001720 [Willaertia magna]
MHHSSPFIFQPPTSYSEPNNNNVNNGGSKEILAPIPRQLYQSGISLTPHPISILHNNTNNNNNINNNPAITPTLSTNNPNNVQIPPAPPSSSFYYYVPTPTAIPLQNHHHPSPTPQLSQPNNIISSSIGHESSGALANTITTNGTINGTTTSTNNNTNSMTNSMMNGSNTPFIPSLENNVYPPFAMIKGIYPSPSYNNDNNLVMVGSAGDSSIFVNTSNFPSGIPGQIIQPGTIIQQHQQPQSYLTTVASIDNNTIIDVNDQDNSKQRLENIFEESIKRPIIFSCKNCRTIITDSNSFGYCDSDINIYSFLHADNIDIRENITNISKNVEDLDYGSNYHSIYCKFCQTEIGKKYTLSDKQPFTDILHHYTLNIDALTTYQVSIHPTNYRNNDDEGEDDLNNLNNNSNNHHLLLKKYPTGLNLLQEIIYLEKTILSIKNNMTSMQNDLLFKSNEVVKDFQLFKTEMEKKENLNLEKELKLNKKIDTMYEEILSHISKQKKMENELVQLKEIKKELSKEQKEQIDKEKKEKKRKSLASESANELEDNNEANDDNESTVYDNVYSKEKGNEKQNKNNNSGLSGGNKATSKTNTATKLNNSQTSGNSSKKGTKKTKR